MLRSFTFLLVAVCATSLPLSAQTFADADRLLASHDTSEAIAALEAMLEHDRKNAEAHYRVGMLYMSRHVPGSNLSPNRRKAEEHFRYATRFESDSAKYWLALAELFRTEEVTTTRVQVAGMVERARKAAREHGGDPLGRVAFRAARIDWERYEQFGHHYIRTLTATPMGTETADGLLHLDAMMEDWNYVVDYFQQYARPDPGTPGEVELTNAESALRDALQSNPRAVTAAGLLAVLLGEEDRWSEAYAMARELLVAAPDSGRAHAILGLTLARLNRWREAKTAYDRALDRMRPDERAPYDNLGMILRMADSIALANRPPAIREAVDSLYWLANKPLYLNPTNEIRTEFFARITYVIHRWSDPLRGYQGYASDRGAVYVRYGPPDIWATLGRKATTQYEGVAGNALLALEHERNTIVWVYYPTRLRFAFSLTPGYAHAAFASDQGAWYDVTRNTTPVRFDNVPVVRTMDTIGTQVAQFRSDSAGKTDVVVFAGTPVGRMVGASHVADLRLVTAAIVKDSTLRDVTRERREKTVRVGDSLGTDVSVWRLALPPTEYRVRVEAVMNALDRAARSAAHIAVRPFGTDSLELSDVVAADRIAPRDSTAHRWTDFFIAPNAGRFPPGVPVALLWEMYNLQPDSAGLVDYQVDIRFTVQQVERHGFRARLLGFLGDATGLSAKGEDQVTLSFQRRREAPADGRAVEYLDVDLENGPDATYLVTLTVTDTHTGRAVSVDRWLTVSALPLTR
jgi:GWxTD domain-containing protein